jgi:hypothetical protein
MWTFQRYRNWLDRRTNWSLPSQASDPGETETTELSAPATAPLPAFTSAPASPPPKKAAPPVPTVAKPAGGRIEIEPVESEFGKILKRPGEK